MITPPIRQIGIRNGPIGAYGKTAAREADLAGNTGSDTFRVEPVRRAARRTERRSTETTANAAALRLGIAAQMLASRDFVDEDVLVLPSHPAMRSAARYASTAEGLAPTDTLGFSRTV
ncbi:MAG: hypothetical protein ACE37E_06610 [Hyphomicrobiales bacterium]